MNLTNRLELNIGKWLQSIKHYDDMKIECYMMVISKARAILYITKHN